MTRDPGVLNDAFAVYLQWGPELERPATARLRDRRPDLSDDDIGEALAYCARAVAEAWPLGEEYAASRLTYQELHAALCGQYPMLSVDVVHKLANRVCYDAVI